MSSDRGIAGIHLWIGTPIGLAVLIAGASAHEPCQIGSDSWTATITEIIDGDTMATSDGRLLRLVGIDAPKRPLSIPLDTAWQPAEAARQGLGQLVTGARVTIAPVSEHPDRYGRWHSNVFLGGTGEWLQATIVRAGLSRVRWLPGDPSCVFALLAAERAARDVRLGIWASAEYTVRRASDLSLIDRSGVYEVIEGRVASVGHGDYMIFVDFGRDYWRDFSVMIPPSVARQFDKTGLVIDDLVGRRVRVRGLIEESGGPAIRLNHPAEMEFLDDERAARED